VPRKGLLEGADAPATNAKLQLSYRAARLGSYLLELPPNGPGAHKNGPVQASIDVAEIDRGTFVDSCIDSFQACKAGLEHTNRRSISFLNMSPMTAASTDTRAMNPQTSGLPRCARRPQLNPRTSSAVAKTRLSNSRSSA